jgi:CRISPR system Cascade subunit CasA
MTSFNLTRERWIPVEVLNGRVVELSTRATLQRAHTLRALADPSPLVVAALTRHLLAVLHRAYEGPRTMREWCAIASSGAFDQSRVDGYLDRVEDRMDLFHPAQPFAQTRGLREHFSKYVDPIDELELPRTGWGAARELFRHRPALPAPVMTAARAARELLAHQAFATVGLIKKPGEPDTATAAPLTHVALVVVRGPTLFVTLIANLLLYDPGRGKPVPTGGADDCCAWEQAPQPKRLSALREPKRRPLGYLDLLTWLSRRVELIQENGEITGFINAVGKGMAEGSPRDPMVAYRRDKKYGLRPIKIDADRAFWRNASALFESTRGEGASFERPQAIDLVADPVAIEFIGRDTMYDIEVLGMDAERAKKRVATMRFERVQTQARCFNDADAGAAVRECLNFSDKLVDALRSPLWVYARSALAPGGRDADAASVRSLVNSFGAEPAAWSALGVVFEGFLRNLGHDSDAATADFRSRAVEVVRNVFRTATARPATTGRWLKARALAERSFQEKLSELTGTRNSQSAQEGVLNA